MDRVSQPDQPQNAAVNESYFIWKYKGKPRLWRQWYDEAGRKHAQLVKVTDEDLETAEGAERAKAKWKGQLITYPCHWCGKPIEMTLSELRFMSVQMLNRYEIGALPTCSKECAEKLVEMYNIGRVVEQKK